MAGSKTRSLRIVAAVACPACGAAAGERCRNPVAHQGFRGPQDRREQPLRPYQARRMAWLDWKQQNGII